MATTAQITESFSPLFRIRRLNASELPTKTSTSESSTSHSSAPSAEAFAAQVLNDGHSFVTSYFPQKFKSQKRNLPSQGSTAKVEIFNHEIKAQAFPQELRNRGFTDETWFARSSLHENAAKSGTGSWEELDFALRQNHSQHEKDYTPDIADAHEVMNWDEELTKVDRRVGGWEDVDMKIMEMRHKIPAPLNNRVFSVLVVAARRQDEIITVQIPIDTKGLAGAKYNDSSKVTAARYASVEWCQLTDNGANVRWQMATASDAGGILPMFAQKMAMPGAISKDPGLVMSWLETQRKKGAVGS